MLGRPTAYGTDSSAGVQNMILVESENPSAHSAHFPSNRNLILD